MTVANAQAILDEIQGRDYITHLIAIQVADIIPLLLELVSEDDVMYIESVSLQLKDKMLALEHKLGGGKPSEWSKLPKMSNRSQSFDENPNTGKRGRKDDRNKGK